MEEVSTTSLIYLLVVLVCFVLLYEKGKKKYSDYVNALDQKQYPLKSLTVVGFALMEVIKYSYASTLDRKLRKQLKECLEEEEYVEFFVRTTWATAATYFMVGIFFSALIAVVNLGTVYVFLVLAFGLLLGYVPFSDINKKVEERHTQISLDLPDFSNKLLILSGAGLSLKAAMVKISKEMSKDTPFYQALKHAVYIMESGRNAEEAMDALCNRCNMPEVRRLSSVLLQNMHSGGADVLLALREISRELWNNRRAVAKRRAEEAGTKMLFPMMLMLLAVILVIAAPAVMSLSI